MPVPNEKTMMNVSRYCPRKSKVIPDTRNYDLNLLSPLEQFFRPLMFTSTAAVFSASEVWQQLN